MSAKGRGRHDGGDEDYYPTPAWCVHRLLDDCGNVLLDCDTALEPTCGDGAIIRAVESWEGVPPRWTGQEPRCLAGPRWTGLELRRDALARETPLVTLATHVEGVDFRLWANAWSTPPGAPHFGLSLGNPPFNIAEMILRGCFSISHVTAMLLRVGFLGSDERVDFFRSVGADPALRILPDRPSFDGVGTDSSTYAWFVWGSSDIRGNKMLNSTPLEIRKAQTPQGLRKAARQGSLTW